MPSSRRERPLAHRANLAVGVLHRFVSRILLLPLLFLIGCERYGVEPGKHAPLFTLNDLAGEPVSLESFRGKVVIVNFWASWCAPCIEELPALKRVHESLAESGVVVLGVGIDDSREKLLKMESDYKLPFRTAHDLTGLVKNSYKVTGVPETFIVDRAGKLQMLLDPLSGDAVVRFTGPRPWDAQPYITLFRNIQG